MAIYNTMTYINIYLLFVNGFEKYILEIYDASVEYNNRVVDPLEKKERCFSERFSFFALIFLLYFLIRKIVFVCFRESREFTIKKKNK